MKNYLICAFGIKEEGTFIHNSIYEIKNPITTSVIEEMREDIKKENGFDEASIISIIPLADETEADNAEQ